VFLGPGLVHCLTTLQLSCTWDTAELDKRQEKPKQPQQLQKQTATNLDK